LEIEVPTAEGDEIVSREEEQHADEFQEVENKRDLYAEERKKKRELDLLLDDKKVDRLQEVVKPVPARKGNIIIRRALEKVLGEIEDESKEV